VFATANLRLSCGFNPFLVKWDRLLRIGTRTGRGKFHAKDQTNPQDDHQLCSPELRSPGWLVPAWARRRFGTADTRHTDTHTDDADTHADDADTHTHTHDAVANPNDTDTHTDDADTYTNPCHPVTHTQNPIAHAAIHQHTDLAVTRPAPENASATRSRLSIRSGGIRNRRHWRADHRRYGAH
jgi:hypothetical protein